MNKRFIERRLDDLGISFDEVAAMPPHGRVLMGLPPIIPQTDYTFVQRLAENYLPRIAALRKLFGLDQPIDLEPPFQFDDPGLGRSYSWYNAQLSFELNRRSVYHLVEEMDNFDLASSSLDVYSEDATQTDAEYGRSVWIESENDEVKRECMGMLDRLNIEDTIFGICRHTAKYGDDFEQVIVSQDLGIVSLEYVSPHRLTRVQDRFGRLIGFAAGIHTDDEIKNPDKWKKLRKSRPWDFVHFRITSSRREMNHGESILMNARRCWRQLKIIEDTLVLYRLNRATDKDIYYIDTGSQTMDQQWQTVNNWRRELRKRFYVNTATGQMRQQYNPRTADEDLYVPMPKDSQTRIERLRGSQPTGRIYDVDHFRNKFFAAMRIPKAYLGFEQDVSARATLSNQDIRFCRGVKRVQRAIKHGLTNLCRFHLAFRDMDPTDAKYKFKVCMAPINYLDELARSEMWTLRQELTERLLSMGIEVVNDRDAWVRYTMKRFLSLNDEELDVFLGPRPKGKEVPGPEKIPQGFEKTTFSEVDHCMKSLCSKGRLLKESAKVLKEDEVKKFEPLPDKETVKKLEELKKEETSFYDLEAEEERLDGVLEENGGKRGTMKIDCPNCKSGGRKEPLIYTFDEAESVGYVRCGHCGFVGIAEGEDVEVE